MPLTAVAATSSRVIGGRRRASAGLPAGRRCPTIYETGGDSVVVQGFVVSADQAGVALPSGEALVEIPAALLAEALRNLG
jgi:hypothetical protein